MLCSDAIVFQKVNWDLERLSLAEDPEKTGLSQLRVAKMLYRRACNIVNMLDRESAILSQLPSRVLSVAFLAYATISQVRCLHRMEPGQDIPGHLPWSTVKGARQVLMASHHAASDIVTRIESPMLDVARRMKESDSASPNQRAALTRTDGYPSAFQQDARLILDNPLCLDDIPDDWMSLFGSGVLEAPTFWTGPTSAT